MRVELKEVKNKGFKPFKIEITIESLAELKDLHNRINIASNVVNDELGSEWCNDRATELFHIIDGKLYDM